MFLSSSCSRPLNSHLPKRNLMSNGFLPNICIFRGARHGTQIFRHACRGVSDTACRVDTRVALRKIWAIKPWKETLINPEEPLEHYVYIGIIGLNRCQ